MRRFKTWGRLLSLLPILLACSWGCVSSTPPPPQELRVLAPHDCEPRPPQSRPSNGNWGNPLPVTAVTQEMAYSCWSTCGQMVMEFIGQVSVRQCCQAAWRFTNNLCCDNQFRLTSHCDATGEPDLDHWGFAFSNRLAQPLSKEEIIAQIGAGRPFLYTSSNSDISHMMTVVGYSQDGADLAVICLDPTPLEGARIVMLPYEEYAGQGRRRHVADHLHIEVKPEAPR